MECQSECDRADGAEMSAPPVARPAKNLNIFISDEINTAIPPGIFEGELGDLPILMSVDVGYDPEDLDPYMCHYESQEVMFAYKKDTQKRVLMQDAFGRTLSLPLQSSLKFRVGADKTDMSMAQIVTKYALPVTVCFARPECMEFTVDGNLVDHTYFGALNIRTVYEEPYLWCLAVEGNGTTAATPIVLPQNLHTVDFCPVVGIKGARDPAAKLKEFVDMYTDLANNLKYHGDPFFQDLAFVSRGPKFVEKVEPYINNTTFIPIHFKRRPPPEVPPEKAPQVPSRTHVPQKTSTGKKGPGETPQYGSLADINTEEHIYSDVHADGDKATTDEVIPGRKPPTGAKLSTRVEKPPRLPRQTERTEEAPGPSAKANVVRSLHKPSTAAKTPAEDPEKPPRVPQRKNSVEDASGDTDSPRHCSVDLAPPVPPPPVVKVHLSGLTVEDVAHKLKELGLEKYAKKFRKNRIDGVLLQKLTEEDVKREFKMNHMEFLLLHTFITEGHIPQTSSSKSGGKST